MRPPLWNPGSATVSIKGFCRRKKLLPVGHFLEKHWQLGANCEKLEKVIFTSMKRNRAVSNNTRYLINTKKEIIFV